MMKRLVGYLGVVVLGMGMTAQANAALIGGPDIISAPPKATDMVVINDHQQAFNERQGVMVTSLAVDGGFVSGRVDSHMIFLNIAITSPQNSVTDVRRVWSFDGEVLGVISDLGGDMEAASNELLGLPGTTYDSPMASRGLEAGQLDEYSISSNSVRVSMEVSQPGDWIRVITRSAVRVPTVSQWGMAVIVILLLAGIWFKFTRHERVR